MTDILWSVAKAFLVGGLLCVVGQVLLVYTKLTNARILVLYVVSGAALTLLGIYKPLVDFAGAGATTPLSGFGYSLAMGAMEQVEQIGILGALSGGIMKTAGGVAAAILFGFLAALCFKPRAKT